MLAMEDWCTNLVKVTSLLLLHLSHPCICSSVELVSSVEEAGRRKACPGETVVFNCTIQATTQLEWHTEPTEGPPVQFAPGHIDTDDGSDDIGEFHALLAEVERHNNGRYTMQSTLTVIATDMVNGTTVYCTDALNSVSSHSQLLLQDPPSSLSPITYKVLSFNRDDVTISVHWEHREGEAVDNFTITATASGDTVSTVHTSPPPANLSLPYNVQYNLSVVASNCAGTATGSAMYEEAGCAVPTAPTGGSVSHFQNATEGSEIIYHCPLGYVLSRPYVAVCTSDLTWVPKGSEANCTKISGGQIEDRPILSYGTAIAITAVPCTVIFLIVGFLLGVLFHHLVTKVQTKPRNSPHTTLPQVVACDEGTKGGASVHNEEKIELRSNEAYASVHNEERIELRSNEAYTAVEKRTVIRQV